MMRAKHIFSILFFLGCVACSVAQGGIVLSNEFVFEDGLYRTFDDFKNNKPSQSWDNLKGNLFLNPEKQNVRVEFLEAVSHDADSLKRVAIQLDSIWGFCIDGIPYIQVSKLKADQLFCFAALETRGNWCYFKYKAIYQKEITFAAFNPVTNQPFRTAKENRSIPFVAEKILMFETGVIHDYDFESLSKLLASDPALYRALIQIDPTEMKTKMMQCLLKYNERHPVWISAQ